MVHTTHRTRSDISIIALKDLGQCLGYTYNIGLKHLVKQTRGNTDGYEKVHINASIVFWFFFFTLREEHK